MAYRLGIDMGSTSIGWCVVKTKGSEITDAIDMFDLPVLTPGERKKATGFRNFLLDEGFEMSQFSVYFRFCGDRTRVDPYVKRIKMAAPSNGKISLLLFTDKQFSDIVCIQNRSVVEVPENPKQYVMF